MIIRRTSGSLSKGFTLIEVLVAVLVLSIGFFALSVLQVAALQSAQGGHMRSQATILGYDIIDAMRSNLPAVSNGDYSIGFDKPAVQSADCYGIAANCTTDQIADSDIARWRTLLGNFLPSGNGQVQTAAVGTLTQVVVSVSWADPYSAEGGTEQLVLRAELAR